MIASFGVGHDTQTGEKTVQIHPYRALLPKGDPTSAGRVVVNILSSTLIGDPTKEEGWSRHTETLILKRTEARAIASAIMGAAAEA